MPDLTIFDSDEGAVCGGCVAGLLRHKDVALRLTFWNGGECAQCRAPMPPDGWVGGRTNTPPWPLKPGSPEERTATLARAERRAATALLTYMTTRLTVDWRRALRALNAVREAAKPLRAVRDVASPEELDAADQRWRVRHETHTRVEACDWAAAWEKRANETYFKVFSSGCRTYLETPGDQTVNP